jgi:hypothetical protein
MQACVQSLEANSKSPALRPAVDEPETASRAWPGLLQKNASLRHVFMGFIALATLNSRQAEGLQQQC